MALPMATRWRWPPDILPGRVSSRSVSSSISAAWFTRSAISAFGSLAFSSAKAMFCRAVMLG